MVKFKFQCKCGNIIEGKTENIMGESLTNTNVFCDKCYTHYRVFANIIEYPKKVDK